MPAAGSGTAEPDLEARFVAFALANPLNRVILDRLDELGAPDVWLVAGCLFQSVWNGLSGRSPGDGIKDYDVFYFDDRDVSYAAEDEVIRRAEVLFADLRAPVEVRNQARVHLWYNQRFGGSGQVAPFRCSRDGIGSFLVRCTCVGMRRSAEGRYEVHAPYGLADLFSGRLEHNTVRPLSSRYREKVDSYRQRWPFLKDVGEGTSSRSESEAVQ